MPSWEQLTDKLYLALVYELNGLLYMLYWLVAHPSAGMRSAASCSAANWTLPTFTSTASPATM